MRRGATCPSGSCWSATARARTWGLPNRENPTDSGDFIAGTFLLCSFEGEYFASLTPAQQKEFEAYFATSGPEGDEKD